MRTNLRFLLPVLTIVMASSANLKAAEPAGQGTGPGVWPVEKARAWQQRVGWLVGSNYNNASAINQLEMWQADTFNPDEIDRELGWAESLGFTSMRVFLHHLPYDQDPKGMLDRMDRFLAIADKHKIGIMFVPFDSVWDPFPKAGKQRDPKPGLHNSGWVQCPSLEILKDPSKHEQLKPYVQGIVGRFKDDKRVHAWDMHNEPDNRNGSSYVQFEPENKGELALAFMRKTFAWAREMNPSQPLTSGVWTGTWGDPAKLKPWEKFQLENSDVITFHDYSPLPKMKERVENLKRYAQGRPILCTEYMARPAGSTFDPVLGYLKEQGVGAYNWGFVAGKSNTIYPWDSWKKPYASEPPVWFHDIFRTDGTPYRPEEVAYIRKVTGKAEK